MTPPAFPDTDFDAQPQEDALRGIVVGRTQLRWLPEALPHVFNRALPAPQPARGGWIDRLHQMWGETWVPALSLGTREARLEPLAERLREAEEPGAASRCTP